MKIVSFDDIRNLNIAPQTCYNWVSEMIADKSNVLLPAKISMRLTEGIFCNVMPCILDKNANRSPQYEGGVKIVTRYPERSPSLDSKLLLYNAESGDFLALMDSNWITAMRTGAVAAHSIMLLARKGFSTLGIVGLGNTARATLLVLASIQPDRELYVKLLKYKGQENLFIERFVDYPNIHFVCVETTDMLVKGSDVVISAATYLPEDICKDKFFEEGVLVVPIHTLGFTNCDLFFDKIYADDYGHVCNFKYFDRFKHFAEVSDVVNGKTAGRENDRERILVYNIGIAMHDINFAAHIYQLICDNQNIVEIDLHDPTEKFWI